MVIKPGHSASMMFETDFVTTATRVMKSMVYDVEDLRVIVSQTSPPLLRSHIGRRMQLSILTRVKSRPARFAASVVIIDMMNEYRMSSSLTTPAIILKQLTEMKEVNLRMFYRVKPVVGGDIVVLFGPEKLNLIDLSLGGAKFSHASATLSHRGEEMDLIFIFNGDRFEVKAKLVRSWSHSESGTNRIQYYSVQFEPDQREFEYYLGKKILMMERQIISAGRI
jgi:hypothetical protein